jgi:hypothetical protein
LHPIVLTGDEGVVIAGFLDRELVQREGRNLERALVDAGEYAALATLNQVLDEQIQGIVPSPRRYGVFQAARARLTPPESETFILLALTGSDLPDASAFDPQESEPASVTIKLEADAGVVLYEWFLREIDEREGANLPSALVTMGEFWALNALANILEALMPFEIRAAFRPQVDAGRASLRSKISAPQALRMAGVESSSVRGVD